MNCDSLIFDLDGTLWDASEAVSQSWAHTLRNTYQVKNSTVNRRNSVYYGPQRP